VTTFYFLDTSALVKRYHSEAGSDKVNKIFDDEDGIILISELAIVELASALQRKKSGKEISTSAMQDTLAQFASDILQQLIVVGFRSGFIQRAKDLVLRHNLRTLDSLQLAAVLEFSLLSPVFACADEALCEAAESVGLTTLNPQVPPGTNQG
jgi:predicted nucleic acid-binding protein